MGTPLDDVGFLARSETRVGVLRALEEDPYDRRDLATATDTPRSTLSRTLGELEDRGWIERNGQRYETTTAGSLVVQHLIPLLDTVSVLQTIGEAVDLLPLEETDLAVQQLAGAEFVTPTELNPTAPFDYGIQRLRRADRFRGVAQTAPPRYVEAIHDGAVSGRLSVECVLAGTYLDEVADDPDVRTRWEEIVSGSGGVWRFDDPLSFVLIVLEDIVHLWLCDETGPRGVVESEAPEVQTWANEVVDRYLERSRPIDSAEAVSRS